MIVFVCQMDALHANCRSFAASCEDNNNSTPMQGPALRKKEKVGRPIFPFPFSCKGIQFDPCFAYSIQIAFNLKAVGQSRAASFASGGGGEGWRGGCFFDFHCNPGSSFFFPFKSAYTIWHIDKSKARPGVQTEEEGVHMLIVELEWSKVECSCSREKVMRSSCTLRAPAQQSRGQGLNTSFGSFHCASALPLGRSVAAAG